MGALPRALAAPSDGGSARGEVPRTRLSEALLDLDGPVVWPIEVRPTRDLTDPELWDVSRRGRGRSAWPPSPARCRRPKVAGRRSSSRRWRPRFPFRRRARPRKGVRRGRGPRRAPPLRQPRPGGGEAAAALGITADGIFGPIPAPRSARSRSATACSSTGSSGPDPRRALPRRAVDGEDHPRVVGPTGPARLGVPADGLYGPVSRAAVRAFQKKRGLDRGRHRRARRRWALSGSAPGQAAPSRTRRRSQEARPVSKPRAGARGWPRSRSATSESRTAGAASRRAPASTAPASSWYVFSRVGVSLRGSSRPSTRSGSRVQGRSGRATSSSSTGWGTTASTSAAAASCTRRAPVTS